MLTEYYVTCDLYVQSKTEIRDKIKAIDEIIDALFDSALKSAAGQNVLQYSLNNGQSIISETYRDSASIAKAINDFTAIRNLYLNRLTGRITRLVDSKSFNNGNRF
jgi:hypothetical protein